MNIKVIFIVGLPGAGKTTLLEQINDGFCIDDFSIHLERLADFKENPESVLYIADPTLCMATQERAEASLRKMLGPDFNVESFEWRFFENDLEACWKNVEARQDQRKIDIHFVKHLSRSYAENYDLNKQELIPVYKGNQNVSKKSRKI